MTEKQLCRNCKHLEHDGMAGIWCGVHGNNKNYDCSDFEDKREKEGVSKMTGKMRDYKKELESAEQTIEVLRDEIFSKNEALYRTEKRLEELKKVIHHQSICLEAYKDVTFKLERELDK